MMVTALRALLRSWHHCGLLPADLSGAVPGVAPWGARRVVSAPFSGQVAAVLASCDQTRTTGRRDFAIVLMLARCGLRRSEVAALWLEDIGWRAGRITIRGKRHRIDVLPLAADVGEALAGYLTSGRPRGSCRAVFVTAKARVSAACRAAPSSALSRTRACGPAWRRSGRTGYGTSWAPACWKPAAP